MFNLILGITIGTIFAPIFIKLFKIAKEKISKKVDDLDK